MLQKNTRYKQVTRLQLFGDDNIFNKTQNRKPLNVENMTNDNIDSSSKEYASPKTKP